MTTNVPPFFRDQLARSTNPFSGGFFGLDDPTGFTTDPQQRIGGIPVPGRAPKFNELVAAALFQAGLARQIRGATRGEADGLFARATQTLESRLGGLNKLFGSLDSLDSDLATSAAARTGGAQVAAIEAARTAGGGRGGLAFGGGAGAIAARGAQGAAATQAAAISNALVQSRLGRAQFQTGVAGLQNQVATALSGTLGQQAQFLEGRSIFDTNLQFNIANLLAGLAQPGSQAQLGNEQNKLAGQNVLVNVLQSLTGGGSGGGGSLGGLLRSL